MQGFLSFWAEHRGALEALALYAATLAVNALRAWRSDDAWVRWLEANRYAGPLVRGVRDLGGDPASLIGLGASRLNGRARQAGAARGLPPLPPPADPHAERPLRDLSRDEFEMVLRGLPVRGVGGPAAPVTVDRALERTGSWTRAGYDAWAARASNPGPGPGERGDDR